MLVVTLRPVELADVPTLRALMADPQVGRLTGSVHTSSGEPELWTLEELTTIYGTLDDGHRPDRLGDPRQRQRPDRR